MNVKKLDEMGKGTAKKVHSIGGIDFNRPYEVLTVAGNMTPKKTEKMVSDAGYTMKQATFVSKLIDGNSPKIYTLCDGKTLCGGQFSDNKAYNEWRKRTDIVTYIFLQVKADKPKPKPLPEYARGPAGWWGNDKSGYNVCRRKESLKARAEKLRAEKYRDMDMRWQAVDASDKMRELLAMVNSMTIDNVTSMVAFGELASEVSRAVLQLSLFAKHARKKMYASVEHQNAHYDIAQEKYIEAKAILKGVA